VPQHLAQRAAANIVGYSGDGKLKIPNGKGLTTNGKPLFTLGGSQPGE